MPLSAYAEAITPLHLGPSKWRFKMLGFASVGTTHSFGVVKFLVEDLDAMPGDCWWELALLNMACVKICLHTLLISHSSF